MKSERGSSLSSDEEGRVLDRLKGLENVISTDLVQQGLRLPEWSSMHAHA